MTGDDIWAVVCRHVREVLTDVKDGDIRPDRTLEDLGANSLDRIDIVVGVLDELRLKISPEELVAAPDLGGLASLFHSRSGQP
ncbi:MAG: phosphopantetheine-binding protein [Frankia sp.]